jgi:uncharacterized protein YjbJ (UPF0337 family)
MTLKSTVETLTHTAVNTAVAAVRDPRGTATKATGLVLDTAGAGIGLVRSRIGGAAEQSPAPFKDAADKVEDIVADKVEDISEKPAATEDPRDHIPGPDLAAFAPPAPEDLPEPIVIEAE